LKIILSRKGFDNSNGGQPSPILPDGTLLSFPIPIPDEKITFSDLFYNNKSFYDLIKELKPTTKKIQPSTTAHLDPDIRKNIYNNRLNDWRPIFGQAGAAQGVLRNNNITINDLFLFFGSFRETEYIKGKLRYKRKAKDQHIIYSYLQIGEIYRHGSEFPTFALLHPHTHERHKDLKSNCIYVSKNLLTFNGALKGANFLKYNRNLVLTKIGMTKGKWDLPPFFRDLKITHHSQTSFKDNYFQSADIGQEFVIETTEEVYNWAKTLIETNDNQG